MPRYILHHQETDLFLEYSTIVDAPTSTAAPYDVFLAFLCHEYGHEFIDEHKERLERARATGCSSRIPGETLRSAISCNRAGRDETEMSYDQFVRHFFLEQRGDEDLADRPVGDAPRDEDEE